MILANRRVEAAHFESRTGWAIKPEGACKGSVCVPLADDAAPDAEGLVDALAMAEQLGMAVVRDQERGLLAIGPETGQTGRVLTTAAAPDLELNDFNGTPFRLSSLHGRKVLLVAWASW